HCAGNVEIFSFGIWTKACGHMWDMRDAQVVCRQLGCGQPLSVRGYFPSNGWSSYEMTSVDCQGSEEYLWACPYERAYSCSIQDASVICSATGFLMVLPSSPSPGTSLSLVNGRNRCEGRIEIYSSGGQGSVCDDSWDLTDAQVVC
ncbi:DMBT1 protein, partial [Eudromia elegans]|nr:DMBT1 protein [Eudromia elegans]